MSNITVNKERKAKAAKKKKTAGLALGIIVAVVLISYNLSNVPTTLTVSDIEAIKTLGLDKKYEDISLFDKEIQCIRQIQKAILQRIPHIKGIPEGKSREPSDLLLAKKGLCYDRSRFIEKALDYYGFKVRHAGMHYSKYPFPFRYLSKANSHAVTEVLTSKGWMLIDSSTNFIGLDRNSNVYSATTLRQKIQSQEELHEDFSVKLPNFYKRNYSVAYGLYSRNGMHYPPYVRGIPDINFRQFISYNFFRNSLGIIISVSFFICAAVCIFYWVCSKSSSNKKTKAIVSVFGENSKAKTVSCCEKQNEIVL